LVHQGKTENLSIDREGLTRTPPSAPRPQGNIQPCIKRVVADSDLEAFQITLEARVDIDSDLINT